MSNPFMGENFTSGRRGAKDGWAGGAIQDAMDQLRGQFDRRAGMRMGRGDVRAAVLALLAEKPMHGYQIIREIEERSEGSWKPSPGSVYPTLQLLTDEALITFEESDGRKTYTLTEAGRATVDASTDRSAPWESNGDRQRSGRSALPKAGFELAQAAAQVGRSGNTEQINQAVAALDEAKRKLYLILAQD